MILPSLSLLALTYYATAISNNALLASWQQNIPDNTLLSQISIPGVYSVQSPASLYTAFQQGARAVDLRLSTHGTDFHLNQDEVPEDSVVTLSAVVDRALSFLRMHPSESILLLLRSDDYITDDLLDFLYRYRQSVYADDWSEGVPKMKDVRGKLWILSSLDDLEGVSPWISWEKNIKSRTGSHGTGMYFVEDLQKVPLASYESILETKLNAVTKNLQRAYASQEKTDLFITYTSLDGNSRYSSLDLIDGIWPTEGLHQQLSAVLDYSEPTRHARAGIVIMDWNLDPTMLTEKLIRPYLTGSSTGPLRIQQV